MFGTGVHGGNRELMPARNHRHSHTDGFGFEEAAAGRWCSSRLAYAVWMRAAPSGEDVLVAGCFQRCGMAAVQIAKLFHCRVIATAGGEAKLAKARSLGADHVVDHYTKTSRPR